MSIKLIASPLQGFTDTIFRNAFNKYFGGIDQYYAPYLRLKGKLELNEAQISEIQPQRTINLVPQIMTKRVDEFLYIATYCKKFGYSEVNWNLGCPYPMVAKRGLGSGLMKNIPVIKDILNQIFNEIDMKISIKLRLGYESKDEILVLLPVLDKFPIANISIHPRIGKQLYKGDVDLDTFEKCMDLTKHNIVYNGDITSLQKFLQLQDRFSTIDTWMLGRGILQNPFLPKMIKSEKCDCLNNKIETFRQFHDEIFQYQKLRLSGEKHVIIKMYQYWEYFIQFFPTKFNGLKIIKKSKNLNDYYQAIDSIFQN